MISKRIKILDGGQQVMVEIQKTHCGGINTDNLINSTCFYLKISRVHMFCSKFSQFRIFCDDNHLKLVLNRNWECEFILGCLAHFCYSITQ